MSLFLQLNLQDVSDDDEKMIDSNSEISDNEIFSKISENNVEDAVDEKANAKGKSILNEMKSIPTNNNNCLDMTKSNADYDSDEEVINDKLFKNWF